MKILLLTSTPKRLADNKVITSFVVLFAILLRYTGMLLISFLREPDPALQSRKFCQSYPFVSNSLKRQQLVRDRLYELGMIVLPGTGHNAQYL